MPPQKTIYAFHVANLRAVDNALAQTGRQLRRVLAEGGDPGAEALTKLYALTIAIKVECRLSKLTFEPNVDDADRAILLAPDSQLDRWLAAIDHGLRTHHAAPGKPLDELTLGHDTHARSRSLRAAVEDDLGPLIELRNKLAHGQWVFPLTESGEVALPQKSLLERENSLTLGLKARLVNHLADVIHGLVVSPRAFESTFENSYRKLLLVRGELAERSFENYRTKLQAQARRGARRRAAGHG